MKSIILGIIIGGVSTLLISATPSNLFRVTPTPPKSSVIIYANEQGIFPKSLNHYLSQGYMVAATTSGHYSYNGTLTYASVILEKH